MRQVFDRLARLSIRFRWVTISITVLFIALGIYAASALRIELLPSIDLPSTYILARSNGSTPGDIMLQAYTVPLEQETAKVEGVVNRESSTSSGFAFLQIRNQFGEDQIRIREDLQAALDGLRLPLRTLRAPAGSTAEKMIADLTPEVVQYLYAYSLAEDMGFLAPLAPEVWRSFSPEVLGALPDEAFADLDAQLADELRAKAVPSTQIIAIDLATTPTPPLPASWQMDRFETAQDLIEITGIRNLADVFNDFVSDGYVTGPLGTTDDLTPADLQAVLELEELCAAYHAGRGSGDAECSMLTYLDGDALAALLTAYGAALEGNLAEGVTLPSGYLNQISQEDRNTVAAALLAQVLTGQHSPRSVELPEEWRLEEPRLITFSFSDIPLGVVSISSDIPRSDLRRIVENEIVPQLEALDLVADVSTEGGEEIRLDLLNEALAAEGLPIEETTSAPGPEDDGAPLPDGAQPSNDPSELAAVPDLPEGPALPASWAIFATQIPGLSELDTADDLFHVPGLVPSDLMNQAINVAEENPVAAPVVNRALADLTIEVVEYLAAHEADFYDHLSDAVIRQFSPELLQDLPEGIQSRAAAEPPAPDLGQFWQRLSAEPELVQTPLITAADLLAFGPAATLNQIVVDTPDALQFYAVQLINNLSPEVIDYLSVNNEEFAASLDPGVFCYFSVAALNAESIQQRWSDQEWTCARPGDSEVAVSAIASGDAQTAAQALIGSNTEERLHDPVAPALPESWPGITGFVGAEELDTADDLFYTVDDGEIRTPSRLLNGFVRPDGVRYLQDLTPDVLLYVADCQEDKLCEENFFDNLSDKVLSLFTDEMAAGLPSDVQARREAVLLGSYVPERTVTRTNGSNSLVLNILKTGDANTVVAWSDVEAVLEDVEGRHPEIDFAVSFEQATYIEESINGVAREGGLGAVMAVVVILIFLNFSVRSTLVTAVSIPTSVALAFVLMKWLPANVHDLLFPLSEDATGISKSLLAFMLRLFPEDISLNIMTLSGLTVAIGRVVDDAIVVLENIYRNIQKGEDQLEAVLHGTRDVSVAIFAATITTVVVFLPIGLFGGIIGAFFLPFGLAVTYALMSSFVVAITVVPLLAYLFISKSSLPKEHHSRLENGYRRAIRWALTHRWVVAVVATLTFAAGIIVLQGLPTAFLPSFGEPTISISVALPSEIDERPTTIAVTDAKVRRLEAFLQGLDGVDTVQTSVGGGGQNSFASSDTVSENVASLTVSVEDQDTLDKLTPVIRGEAERLFDDLDRDGRVDANQNNVTVSGASLSEQGFGGFALVISGDPDNPPTLVELQQYDDLIIRTLDEIAGIANVESSLAEITGTGASASQMYIRIDGIPAIRYTAELETDDTLGLTQEAIQTVEKLDLPENITVGEGFESEQQSEGFQQMFVSMGIAVLIVYFVMVLTFGSLVHPVTILFSLPLAVVGAAVGLDITNRVLGLSSVVGLLMLVGIVVTNAIVLVDRVQTNRKVYKMSVQEALIDGAATRLRPILMTAIATMVALLPLAIGLSKGAIIAAELGTVVIGGLFSSTLLTLVVVPVMYSAFDSGQQVVRRRILRKST